MHEAVIAIAERYEPIVLADRRFGLASEKMIRVRQHQRKSRQHNFEPMT